MKQLLGKMYSDGLPPQSYLQERFDYDPNTGWLVWKTGQRAGHRAGTITHRGYRQIKILDRLHMEHRIIWVLMHGELPEQIDHINRVRDDNRLSNLRAATANSNCWNTPQRADSRQPYKGVKKTKEGKYTAQAKAFNKLHHLGTYSTPEQAYQAYLNFAVKREQEGEACEATKVGVYL